MPRSKLPEEYQPLKGSDRRPRRGARRIGPANPREVLTVSVYVRPNPKAAPLRGQEYWSRVPLGRRTTLTRDQLANEYGAAPADIDRVVKFGRSHRLKVVETSLARRRVALSGTVADMNKAFGIELGRYETPNERYRGREGPLHLPKGLAEIVVGIFGLDNRRMARRVSNGSGAGTVTPPQVAAAYNFPVPPNGAAGQTVAVLEFSGPTSNEISTCGFAQSDIDAYIAFLNKTTGTNLQTIHVTPVPVDKSTDAPGDVPGGSASNFTIEDPDVEVALDLEIIVSLAQGAAVVAYFAPSTEQGWVDAITQIVADKTNHPDVLSISWGWSELEADASIGAGDFPEPWPFEWTQGAFTQMTAAFQSAANIGMTVFAASGDDGSNCEEDDGNAHVIYPASDPWVTACGGTITNALSPLSQDTWNDNASGDGATGGGVSDLVGPQLWQADANVPPSVNTNRRVGRGVPDIAGNASPNSGYILELYGETSNNLDFTSGPGAGSPLGPVGGTSAVAPLYAALIARINAILGVRAGYLNPTLYSLGAANPSLIGLGGLVVFQDVNDGVSNGVTWVNDDGSTGGPSPGYVSGQGWDPCTGWGTINGSALLAALQGVLEPSMTMILDRSTFSQDEVPLSGATFPAALFVIVDGVRPTEFPGGGITTLSPTLTQLEQWAPSIPSPVAPGGGGVTNIQVTPTQVSSDDPSLGPEAQRFTFTYKVVFPDQTAFGYPGSGAEILMLTASLAATTGKLSVSADIELIKAADPYFSNEAAGNVYWLSEDLRVFNAEQGSTLFGAPPLGSTAADALNFIQWIIKNLQGPNGTGPNGDTFENTLTPSEQGSALSLFPTALPPPFGSGLPVFNFVIARVRLNGDAASDVAKKVRLFFRLLETQATTAVYQTPSASAGASPATGPFRQWSDGTTDGQKIPLLGISSDGTEYVTVPFFASPRVANTSLATNMTSQVDPPNARQIAPVPGSTVYAYFGAWLDTNQTTPVLPNSVGANPDGPFTGPLNSIGTVLLRGGHQCLVSEIVDDEAPIINGGTPSTSDKLAQRNVAFTVVANPGLTASRNAFHTFEIRPSLTVLNSDQRPDELMIDWGKLPAGSTASIYLPAVLAADVIALASLMYPSNDLSASDAHTIRLPAGGTSYIPIPKGSGGNFAGLLSIELPFGIRAGQEFQVVVRQVTSVMPPRTIGPPNPRFVYGTFQFTVPVSTKEALLLPEERTLAFMKWIQQNISPANRWYPVFIRYVDELAGMVNAIGGDAGSIPASPTGNLPGIGTKGPGKGEGPPETGWPTTGAGGQSWTGKVAGVVYDHFGDFEAFILETEGGDRHRFDSRELPILRVVEDAWLRRIRITVIALRDRSHQPYEIILDVKGPPPGD